MPAPHPPEFRQRAVELARQGAIPVSKIAKDLGISDSCLRNWMHQADADESGGGDRLASPEKKELAELRCSRRPESRGSRSGSSTSRSATPMAGRSASRPPVADERGGAAHRAEYPLHARRNRRLAAPPWGADGLGRRARLERCSCSASLSCSARATASRTSSDTPLMQPFSRRMCRAAGQQADVTFTRVDEQPDLLEAIGGVDRPKYAR